ncbi:uncharacterized protein TRAVEDRAFT_59954 [Trametes versicolor FP-101664 SS1]|uniref:uncharacterized protein n=1 Tax=Trametes versicolor (strain FP-101664) TaxID=717944 RepID=UPI00046218CA|nr:uncharacterized protein TRAVEDRAFT_59954 [Trametes versicolor FP-101664 SS1]EIW55719.1 hypothetical protein TRAVEDRAFT_59954 [Trametes versicolor FP-101664 SS1]
MPLTLAHVPEEILERILALILVQSPESSPRPSWHPYTNPNNAAGHANIISPLLVCRAWLRIATPIHYRHPVLRTPRHAELLLRALRHTPDLALCVRSLHLHATSPALRDIVPRCAYLHTLDITVDNADAQPGASGRDRNVVDFCEGFMQTRSSIRHLIIRKNAYLTQPNATYVFEQLAKAIVRWHKLETVNVAFRLSPSPAATALTQALAAAPRLHTLHTQLPAVWNTTLLDIAQNPSLVRIVLFPAPEHAGAHLFLAEAKRHPRLVDLIRAGTAPAAPHPAGRAAPHISFSLAGNARARAASSVVPPGSTPMPVPTWGYEREVPAPVCPPSSSRGPAAYPPSAYAYPQAPVAAAPQYVYPQAPVVAPPYPYGQPPSAYQHGHHHAGYAPRVAVPNVPELVHGQAQRRAAGSRRMTAS